MNNADNHTTSSNLENTIFTATLGGGCYWCLEAMFNRLKGISNVRNGFSGGVIDDPSYEAVCAGNTGHAEVIQFDYDPDIINYIEILKIYFTAHNPTTLNRQGNDVGTQYRSVVFFHDNFQRLAAEEIIKFLEKNHIWKDIVTEIEPFEMFYAAPDYHEDYFARNPNEGYCQMVIAPKVSKFNELFAEKLNDV